MQSLWHPLTNSWQHAIGIWKNFLWNLGKLTLQFHSENTNIKVQDKALFASQWEIKALSAKGNCHNGTVEYRQTISYNYLKCLLGFYGVNRGESRMEKQCQRLTTMIFGITIWVLPKTFQIVILRYYWRHLFQHWKSWFKTCLRKMINFETKFQQNPLCHFPFMTRCRLLFPLLHKILSHNFRQYNVSVLSLKPILALFVCFYNHFK